MLDRVRESEQPALLAKHAAQFLRHIRLAIAKCVVAKTEDGLEKFMPLLVPNTQKSLLPCWRKESVLGLIFSLS